MIVAGIEKFTEWHRRFRYLGSQFAKANVPATTSPVAENALDSHFVVGHPSHIVNWETECSSTMRPGSTSAFIPGVSSHNRKAVGVPPLAAYICQVTSAGPGAFVGATMSIKYGARAAL